jgi:hypothetical protein
MFQISFLNAGLLFLTAATILPLVIWLLAKKRPRIIIFSSLRFIRLSNQHEKSRTRISNIILLIIRMLIILLIMLAIARPMLSSPGLKNAEAHPPTAVAIILDTSYSMDYVEDRESRLDKALKAILEVNARAGSEDRLILISRDAAFNDLYSQIFTGKIPEEILKSITLSYNPLGWEECFAFAESRLEEAQMPNREIYLLSDLMNEDISYKSRYPVAVIPITEKEARQNLVLSEARVLGQIVERGARQSIEFLISNHGSQDRGEVLVQAVVNDVKVGEKFISISARQSKKETISFQINEEGWQSGYIEVLDEFLAADNRSYFAFEYYRNPRVAVIGNQALPPHLKSILRVFGGGKDPDILDVSQLNMQSLDTYQIFIFQPFVALNTRIREIIAEMDKRGIGSVYCPGSELNSEAKAWLQNRFDIQLKEYRDKPVNVDFLSPYHHATALAADKELRFAQITAYWDAGSGASALISAGAKPLVLEEQNSALWLWDISRDSAFFADPTFAVYAYRQLATLLNTTVPFSEVKVGDALSAFTLGLPTAEQIDLAGNNYITAIPGIYTMNPQSPRAARVAVNMDYNDSDVLPVELPKEIIQLPEDFARELFMARLGRDLWKILLILAVMLMLLEIGIVKYLEHRATKGDA